MTNNSYRKKLLFNCSQIVVYGLQIPNVKGYEIMKLIQMIKQIFAPAPKEIDVKQKIVLAELQAENMY